MSHFPVAPTPCKAFQPTLPAPPLSAYTVTYKAGQTIDVHFFITTNHYGRIEFRLCPLSATSQGDCTKLQRWGWSGVQTLSVPIASCSCCGRNSMLLSTSLTAVTFASLLRLCRADGQGEAWDLPAIAEGSRFNGGALGIDNLKPTETDSSFSWWVLSPAAAAAAAAAG
jgi:hypothetical protein